MGLTVFDADVLVGFVNAADLQHEQAVRTVGSARGRGDRCEVCAVTLAEVLVGPERAGTRDLVESSLRGIGLLLVEVDRALAHRAAWVRAVTRLKLPDAFVLATATRPSLEAHADIASFDERLLRAHRELAA